MEFDCYTWLMTPSEKEGAFKGKPLHEQISYLLRANGGPMVAQWGFVNFDEFGHQKGLYQDEAVTLIGLWSFMEGLNAAGAPIVEVFKPFYESYQKLHSRKHGASDGFNRANGSAAEQRGGSSGDAGDNSGQPGGQAEPEHQGGDVSAGGTGLPAAEPGASDSPKGPGDGQPDGERLH